MLYSFNMEKTVVVSLRLPIAVAKGVERLAHRSGHKPAQVTARLVEEGLRRRDFPYVDLRDTAAGRTAYISGTRFAVYWVTEVIQDGMSPEKFASQYELPVEKVRMALGYAAAFPEEMKLALEHVEANRRWVAQMDAACRRQGASRRGATARRKE